mmetsp:Transcript_12257/g.33059  ORF Transcript_12257/g.33059 Transcript_12257/m.33059 type:complete len:312 (+) Transcript_12257:29-964(+)
MAVASTLGYVEVGKSAAPVAHAERRARGELKPALEQLGRIHASLARDPRRVVFLLDYDGTLSPIVEDPDQALLPERTRETLEALGKAFPTAIVSGRAVEKIRYFVGLDELIYAGSHGFDIRGPNGSPQRQLKHEVASEFRPALKSAAEKIRARVADVAGCSLEDNSVCFSVHYRRCAPEDVPFVSQAVEEVLTEFHQLRRTAGKCVFEVRPRIDWNKGKAVEWLLHALDLADDRSLPIYIGDDKTDEDAFRVLCGRGLSCLVASDSETLGVPSMDASDGDLATYADFRLRDPSEVRSFLESFLDARAQSTF